MNKETKRDYVLEKIKIDHRKVAQEYTEFQTVMQKQEAMEDFNQYILFLSQQENERHKIPEIKRRMREDILFRNKMLNSVVQLSCLISSSLIEGELVFDYVFPVVQEKSAEDYDEVKAFKQYLLNTFVLEEIEDMLHLKFTEDTLATYHIRFNQIKQYFFHY